MNFLELVTNRYSCRNYKNVVPEQEKLNYVHSRLEPLVVIQIHVQLKQKLLLVYALLQLLIRQLVKEW